MVDRFELLEEVGVGGMGAVWRARALESGEIVALKLLHHQFVADAEYVARFAREVEIAQRVDSPFVVKVLGFGRHEGTPFVAMEYIEGQSLRERLKASGPVGWDEARRLAIQMTQALAAAHAAGVIHRDIKPSNVLLDAAGNVKLADFGIARAIDLTRMTGSVTVLGTPAYMAPEGESSEQSDLYGLGCVLYELLTGAPPFEGESQQHVLLKHIREAPHLERLPGEARPIVGWLLEKAPRDRPASAAALLAVLQRPTTASWDRSSGSWKGTSSRKRHVLLFSAICGALVAVAGVGASALIAWRGNDSQAETWTIVSREVAVSTPPPGESAAAITVGPFVYGPDFLVISFKARPQCATDHNSLGWRPDVGTSNVQLRTRSGEQVLSSAGWGLGTADAQLRCDTDYVGTWVFATEEQEGLVLEYTSPKFQMSVPEKRDGANKATLTLDIPQAFRRGERLTVPPDTQCLAALEAPAFGAPPVHCFGSGESVQVIGGPIDNVARWWELRAGDGTSGWVEQSDAERSFGR